MITFIISLLLSLAPVDSWRHISKPPKPFALPHWEQGVTATLGWSNISPSSDTIATYVSSSLGDDSNNGLWPGPPGYRVGNGHTADSYIVPDGPHNGPKKTIAAGKAMLRNGYADWLLLKAGDQWTETFGEWNISGRSNNERIVITSYSSGTEDRPLINIGTNMGLYVNGGHTTNNLAVVGLAIVNNANNNGGLGFQFYGSMNNLLIEDCLLSQGVSEVVFNCTPRSSNIAVRRNIITDTWAPNNGAFSAIFLAGVDGTLIEENVFDRCGHRPGFPPPPGVVLPHIIYNQGGIPSNGRYNTGVIMRGNVFSRSDGLLNRSDVEIRNNLFLKISIACMMGGTNHDNPTTNPNGTIAIGVGNAFIDGYDFVDGNENTPSGAERGIAFAMCNNKQIELGYNIIANNVHGNAPTAFMFNHADDAGNSRGTDGGSIHDNIVYNWAGGHAAWWNNNTVACGMNAHPSVAGFPTIQNVTLANNSFQYNIPLLNIMRFDDMTVRAGLIPSNNKYWCGISQQNWANEGSDESMQTWMNRTPQDVSSQIMQVTNYPNPGITAGSYYQSIGARHGVQPDGTLESYLNSLRLSQRKNWMPELMPTYSYSNQSYTYMPGNVVIGPLFAIRQAFGLVVP